jgi:crooked neck
VFERAVGAVSESVAPELPAEELSKPDVWLAFAHFEARRNEPERARSVYQFSLEKVHPEFRGRVFASFAAFEKQLKDVTIGDDEDEAVSSADMIVILRRREEYESILKSNPRDYDVWFDLIRLEESQQNVERVRSTYERAQSFPPEGEDAFSKRQWRRFVYLFIYECLFEELIMKDVPRARNALKKSLDVVPHSRFTFAKLWIMAAHLEIRQKKLREARMILGRAIGLCPKDKIFRSYIQLELQLGQVDRCRVLYEKYLAFNPANSQAWHKFAELEKFVGEMKRARAIYELGIGQAVLDEPEKLWLHYIDFEIASDDIEEEDVDDDVEKDSIGGAARAKALYERLIARTEGKQARVWIALAKFLAFGSSSFTSKDAREVLEQAERTLKGLGSGGQEGRAQVCEARVDLEKKVLEMELEADRSFLDNALERIPKKVERISDEDGAIKVEWLFPADVREEAERRANDAEAQKKAATLKMLELAQQRKRMKESNPGSS